MKQQKKKINTTNINYLQNLRKQEEIPLQAFGHQHEVTTTKPKRSKQQAKFTRVRSLFPFIRIRVFYKGEGYSATPTCKPFLKSLCKGLLATFSLLHASMPRSHLSRQQQWRHTFKRKSPTMLATPP